MDINKLFSFYCFIILMFTLSCTRNNKELAASTVTAQILKKDTVPIDQKLLVKIFLNNKRWGIHKAYFACDTAINEVNKNVDSILARCKKELFIKQDTVLIQFSPTVTGSHKFEDITLLLKEKSIGKYQILDTTFYYFVQ